MSAIKIVNKPIEVIAVFCTDGKIEPVKFRLDEEVFRIEKVLRIYTENIVGNDIIVFVCQHNGRDIYMKLSMSRIERYGIYS